MNPALKMNAQEQIVLLAMSLLGAYQVAIGIEGLDTLPITAYTIAFGVLIVSGFLMIILGFDALDTPWVAALSTLIPLALSTGMVWEHLDRWRSPYLGFAVVGFLAVLAVRILPAPKRLAAITVAVVHGVAGLTIFVLPSARRRRAPAAPDLPWSAWAAP